MLSATIQLLNLKMFFVQASNARKGYSGHSYYFKSAFQGQYWPRTLTMCASQLI